MHVVANLIQTKHENSVQQTNLLGERAHPTPVVSLLGERAHPTPVVLTTDVEIESVTYCWKYCSLYTGKLLLLQNLAITKEPKLESKYIKVNTMKVTRMQTIIFFESSPGIPLSARQDTPRLVLTDWRSISKDETTFLLLSSSTSNL